MQCDINSYPGGELVVKQQSLRSLRAATPERYDENKNDNAVEQEITNRKSSNRRFLAYPEIEKKKN